MTQILNVGCGDNYMPDAVNLDGPWNDNSDIQCDLERDFIPLEWNRFDVIILSHVIEHMRNVLPMMQELWLVAKPDAVMYVTCPHGASDDADEDPTHVRRMFPLSFCAFAQPYYHKADYGYLGDWQAERVLCLTEGFPRNDAYIQMLEKRNTITELYAELRAVKPARSRFDDQKIVVPQIIRRHPDWIRGKHP